MAGMKRIAAFFSSPYPYACALALACAVLAVWWGGVNQDEGWYLYAAQRVGDGALPYRDFFFTQGPTMPFVYAFFAPLWAPGSPLAGLLGGRIVTWLLSLLATFVAVGFARRLVDPARRTAVSVAVFALLSCNLYHVYYTTIPKTYALGSLFVAFGFLFFTYRGAWAALASGLAFAFASGTRISLILILPVVGISLLASFRSRRWDFLWFGLGGAAGLFLVYGFFALDPASCAGLLAAQAYHAARGGFDPFFALGSVSRLARGYAAFGGVLLAGALVSRAKISAAGWTALAAFALVCGLQLAAPFPYDDYQVPVALLAVVPVAVWFVGGVSEEKASRAAWFALLVAGLASFSSPLLQEWATYDQDRFWSQKKEMTELAKVRAVGAEIEALDPGGKDLLTQDLYLAVETGRRVPDGLEMGPFSYFDSLNDEEAARLHVMNPGRLAALLEAAPCRVAACSGYTFAIAVPKCEETPYDVQRGYWERLRKHYDLVATEPRFGQNATPLLLLERKEAPSEP